MNFKTLVFLLIIILSIQAKRIFAQDVVGPKAITCVSVQTSGDVMLTFLPPLVSGNANFDFFEIYYSIDKNGPYNIYIDPNNNNPSLTNTIPAVPIPNPDANNQAYYFYTVVSYTANATSGLLSYSDTVSTIYLEYSSANDGNSNLTWNAIRNPLLPTSSSYYQVKRGFKEYNLPIYTSTSLSDSTTLVNYTDNLIGKCDDDVTYLIEIRDFLSGCFSKSNAVTNSFLTPGPDAPFITNATKNNVGLSIVNWLPSTSIATQGYKIYKDNCGSPDEIATKNGINSVTYTDIDTLLGCEKCISFRVASFFNCPTYVPPGNGPKIKVGQPSLFHNSITVSHTFNQCTYEASLSWCAYKNWTTGVKEYNVWVSKNGAPFSVAATLDPSSTNYNYISGKEVATYVFQIEAKDVSGNFNSMSNFDTLFAAVPKQPIEVYLKYVTILPNGFVKGNFTNDTLASLKRYEIFRSESVDGTFEDKVAVIPFHPHKDTLQFKDTTALTSELSYFYKVQAIDSCENKSLVSNIAKTIFLETTAELNFTSEISWSNYVGWVSGVNYYEIYRSYSNRFEERLIKKQLLDSGITYIDDFSDTLNPDGHYCYRVMGVSVFDTIHYSIDSSYSNFVCIRQTPHIFVPNAFTPPDGYNPVFKPTMIFIPNESYELKIFDRWGTLICTSNKVDQGWDGSYRGVQSQEGLYSWQIRYKNMKNEFVYLNGTVALVR